MSAGAAIAGAAGGIADGLMTSAFNLFSAEQSRDYNREMASTAHQREVKDLRAAGLNPVLSAGGHGASVAPSPTPQAHNFGATDKAIQLHQMRNQDRLVDAQVRDINSAATLKEIDGVVKLRTQPEAIDTIREQLYHLRQNIDMTDVQRKHLDEVIETMGIERGIKRNELSHSAYDLSKAKSESHFYDGFGGDIEHWMKMLGIQLPGVGALRFLKGGRSTLNNHRLNRREQKESTKKFDRFKKNFDTRKAGEPLMLKPEFQKGG